MLTLNWSRLYVFFPIVLTVCSLPGLRGGRNLQITLIESEPPAVLLRLFFPAGTPVELDVDVPELITSKISEKLARDPLKEMFVGETEQLQFERDALHAN